LFHGYSTVISLISQHATKEVISGTQTNLRKKFENPDPKRARNGLTVRIAYVLVTPEGRAFPNFKNLNAATRQQMALQGTIKKKIVLTDPGHCVQIF
jgi:N-acetylmuramoyl-L-alanine amidase